MQIRVVVAFIFIAGFMEFSAEPARADQPGLFSFAIVGGTNFSRSSEVQESAGRSVTIERGTATLPSLGAFLEWRPDPILGLELDFLYLQRRVYRLDEASTIRVGQTTALLRIWPTSFISLGIGYYFSRGIGAIQITSASGVEQSKSFEQAELNPREGGYVAALGLNIPLDRQIAFLAEARANTSRTNASAAKDLAPDAKVTVRFFDAQAFAGIRWYWF